MFEFTYNLRLTLAFSYHSTAWFLDKTLQSKIALLGAGLARATDRPTLTDSVNCTWRSWNGCEFCLHVNTATAAIFDDNVNYLLFSRLSVIKGKFTFRYHDLSFDMFR